MWSCNLKVGTWLTTFRRTFTYFSPNGCCRETNECYCRKSIEDCPRPFVFFFLAMEGIRKAVCLPFFLMIKLLLLCRIPTNSNQDQLVRTIFSTTVWNRAIVYNVGAGMNCQRVYYKEKCNYVNARSTAHHMQIIKSMNYPNAANPSLSQTLAMTGFSSHISPPQMQSTWALFPSWYTDETSTRCHTFLNFKSTDRLAVVLYIGLPLLTNGFSPQGDVYGTHQKLCGQVITQIALNKRASTLIIYLIM